MEVPANEATLDLKQTQIASRPHWWLGAMLLALHYSLSWGIDGWVARAALLAHFGCSTVVITRGADGLNVFEDTSTKSFHVSATSSEIGYDRVGQAGVDHAAHGRQVFDVTGAGDTVLSVLALAVAARVPIREAAVLANAGAGVVVGKLGTSTITPGELFAAVRDLR